MHMASLLFMGRALPEQILLFIVIYLFKTIIIHEHLKNVVYKIFDFNNKTYISKNTVFCTLLGTGVDNKIHAKFKNTLNHQPYPCPHSTT